MAIQVQQWLRALVLGVATLLAVGAQAQAPNTTPIRVGSTLALPLARQVHTPRGEQAAKTD